MRLSSDAESTASWPSEFAATYVASLDDAGALTTSLDIHNAGSEPMTFTTALHTYFRCADALTARVEGLRGREYLDSLDGRVRKTEDGARRDATRRDAATPHSSPVALEPARDASNARPYSTCPDALPLAPLVSPPQATR